MIGGFIAAFIIAQFIAVGGYLSSTRMGLRDRVRVLHRGDVHPAAGPVSGAKCVTNASARLRCRDRRARSAVLLLPRCGAHCVISRRPGKLSAAPADPDPAVGLHLHRLVADGPVRPDVSSATAPSRASAPTWWCCCGILSASTPWLGIPVARRAVGRGRAAGRLSVLPLAHHRPLFRAGDAGADRSRAAGASSACATTPAARSATPPNRAVGGGDVAAMRCSSPTSVVWFYIVLALWLVGL